MRAIIACPRGCQDLHVQKLHTFAALQLNQTKVKCPYSYNGCQEHVLYSDFIEHALKTCGFLHGLCQCGAVVLQKDIINHFVEVCPYYQKRCRKCNLQMARKDLHRTLDDCLKSLLDRNKVLEAFAAAGESAEKPNSF